MSNSTPHPASYRDPAGFMFESEGQLYRQVNLAGKEDLEQLMQSGLYKQLTDQSLLISHQTIDKNFNGAPDWYSTLQPEILPVISYPWEWSFATLQEAALLTLRIMRLSIGKGMILKDATPFNVQIHKGRLIFIDTLSFTNYTESKPWDAYRQFCETFLFPLYIEHYTGMEGSRLLSIYPDGIPAATTAALLPWKSKWNLGVRLHVLLQSKVGGNAAPTNKEIRFSKTKMQQLLQHLESIIKDLKTGYPENSVWNHYYDGSILGPEYLEEKTRLIRDIIGERRFQLVLDLGANDGHFSKLLATQSAIVVATDSDRNCIQRLYKEVREKKMGNVYPLLLDITNPSAGIGFENKERTSFFNRVHPDMAMALALIHHLAIGKNIPLERIARHFHELAPEWIVEFVPKSDEKVQQLLANRTDIFDHYDQAHFERLFGQYFHFEQVVPVTGTGRILYFMKRKPVA